MPSLSPTAQHDAPPSTPDVPALVTVAEAADALRITAPTVRQLVREGRLEGFRVGRSYRIKRSSLDKLIAGQ